MKMSRQLTPSEHTIAEQGLLNLALQDNVRIISKGDDITLALITAAPTINAEFDKLHQPTPAPQRGHRKATAKAGPPRKVTRGKPERPLAV